MEKLCLFIGFFLITTIAFTQTKPKPTPQKKPAQSEMDKMMEEAMQGMSLEEKAEMRKMMKEVMPTLNEVNAKTADYPEFSNNKLLLPAKDAARINSINNKSFSQAEVISTTTTLFSKLMLNAPASEKAIINKVVAKEKKAAALMAASIIAFLQGHNEAAIGLSMKAVLADGSNLIYQNNMAAMLTQCGYADKAIPYLRKLLLQQPGNSTLHNNMGYAWFYLGEKDSAKKYIQFALRRNPAHAEARLCAGVLKEAEGDPVAAAKEYEKSFEEIPNSISERTAKNRNTKNPVETIDYKKLIGEITVYEYFTKEWSQMPSFDNTVAAYEKNKGKKESYDKMYKKLYSKVKEIEQKASKEINDLQSKGEDEFVKTMTKENLKGINMMSKPALYIMAILSNEQKRMMAANMQEDLKLRKYIEEQLKIRNSVSANPKCGEYEEKAEKFMQAVNPKIKEHWEKRLEEFRIWLNAWCTWRWYITGNAKNTVTVELTNWINGFLDLHSAAMRDLRIEQPHCRPESTIYPAALKDLDIPYFNCPAVVEFPVNTNLLKLSAEAAALSKNNSGIEYKGGTIPNVSLSFGIGKSNITEPGLYGNPYFKTADGNISQSGNNYAGSYADDELVPITKIPPFELEPLDKKLLPKKPGSLSAFDKKALAEANIYRQLLNKKLKTDCSFIVGQGTLEFEEPKLIVGRGELTFEGKTYIYDEAKDDWIEKTETKFIVGVGELIFEELPPEQPVKPSMLETVISNGMQMITKAGSTIINLFK
ncbi:tetratricopeptide repeat protein [Lacibacter sediminis]|uniref:Tetratricopeptide repeat protein n=1 Tax=Lacibacter sediminis TaxID=2760713 RepID=A0A7G5XLN5_9BACT|nr:hypothetical protein [Lacibacter sediminis]QNA46388.1 hypothetical protein H4075_09515 [Lacibacter sediminis]